MKSKKYYLDWNHNKNSELYTNSDFVYKLRSGDIDSIEKLSELSLFFTNYFGYPKSSFFDYSPWSICKLLELITASNNTNILAVSKKISHFCYEAVLLAEKCGIKIIWIELDDNGFLEEYSLKNSKQAGASILFLSLVDEDIFTIENLTIVNKYFSNQDMIVDVSNAVDCLKIANNFKAIFFWGMKLGASKNSGILLHDLNILDFIDRLDLQEYEKIKNIIMDLKFEDLTDKKELFARLLKLKLGDNFTLLIDTHYTKHNVFCGVFRGIKARDLIRSLALESIYVTNGEYCSLGLSKPSRIYILLNKVNIKNSEILSISFHNLDTNDIEYLATKIAFKYIQLKSILDE